jgi:hypothetical protein
MIKVINNIDLNIIIIHACRVEESGRKRGGEGREIQTDPKEREGMREL